MSEISGNRHQYGYDQIEYEYMRKMGIATVIGKLFGVWTIEALIFNTYNRLDRSVRLRAGLLDLKEDTIMATVKKITPKTTEETPVVEETKHRNTTI